MWRGVVYPRIQSFRIEQSGEEYTLFLHSTIFFYRTLILNLEVPKLTFHSKTYGLEMAQKEFPSHLFGRLYSYNIRSKAADSWY